MTTTVSLDGLRELSGFRAEHGCAISLYLDLDPSVTPTAGDAAASVRSLLDAAARSSGSTRAGLGRASEECVEARVASEIGELRVGEVHAIAARETGDQRRLDPTALGARKGAGSPTTS